MRNASLTLFVALAVSSPLGAQRVEWGAGGVALVTGSEFRGGGLELAWRTPGRLRLGVLAAAGEVDARLAGRAEAMVSYHVNPVQRGGISPYAGGGLAVTFTADEAMEYLTVTMGFEGNPGGAVGWYAEVGLSGGVRLALGLRVRP